jgi:predicted enzyme related to lactoylglutathione lyase
MKKNTVSHFEIYADNPEALAKFYTQLFDWDVQPMPEMPKNQDFPLFLRAYWADGGPDRQSTPPAVQIVK